MSASYRDNSATVLLSVQQKSGLFLRFLLDEVDAGARPVTPKRTGRLSQSTLKTVNRNRGRIEWRKIYAQYQERGARRDGSHPVRHYSTPGTGRGYALLGVRRAVAKAPAILKKVGLQ